VAHALRDVLRSNLVAVYVYGSLTQGAFDPARSDLDCLVIVRRDLSPTQARRLRARLARAAHLDSWVLPVQMQVLRQNRLLRPDHRGHLYQFGVLRQSGSDGNPLIWMNVLATGVTLVGPPPQTLLPPITDELFFAALVRELEYLRAEIMNPASEWRGRTFYRAYARPRAIGASGPRSVWPALPASSSSSRHNWPRAAAHTYGSDRAAVLAPRSVPSERCTRWAI
jgi:hypothetical protein